LASVLGSAFGVVHVEKRAGGAQKQENGRPKQWPQGPYAYAHIMTATDECEELARIDLALAQIDLALADAR
jgi:hypothetical protein